MVLDVTASSFLYINGICTGKEVGDSTRCKLQEILQRRVYFHHNPAALEDKFYRTVAEISVGAGLGLYALNEENKRRGKSSTRAIGAGGVALLALGLKDYSEIQEEKNAQAERVARKVIRFLQTHPHRPLTLVLHSQGADVGQRALERIPEEFRQRIRAVTLGGMVAIPEDLCGYVINFQLNYDPVPVVVGMPLNFITTQTDGRERKICYIQSDLAGQFAHGVDQYLNHPAVMEELKLLGAPN